MNTAIHKSDDLTLSKIAVNFDLKQLILKETDVAFRRVRDYILIKKDFKDGLD